MPWGLTRAVTTNALVLPRGHQDSDTLHSCSRFLSHSSLCGASSRPGSLLCLAGDPPSSELPPEPSLQGTRALE